MISPKSLKLSSLYLHSFLSFWFSDWINSTAIFESADPFTQSSLSLKHSIEFFSLFSSFMICLVFAYIFQVCVEILTLLMHYSSDFGDNLYFELFIRSLISVFKVYFSSFIFYSPLSTHFSQHSVDFCALCKTATFSNLDRVVLFRR